MRRHRRLVALGLLGAARAVAQTGGTEHVPPDPPQTRVHDMPYREMAEMMGMDDRRNFGAARLDRLEWRGGSADSTAWEGHAWYGGDYDKLWFDSEGAHAAGATESRNELLWDHIASAWWSTRVGVRQDLGDGDSRTWAAFGIAGLAPGFIEIQATGYVGESGHTALRLAASHDLLLTQRCVLGASLEVDAYDEGYSDAQAGLRLRYEIRREFAPYVGVQWQRHAGDSEVVALAGLRLSY